MLTRDGWIKRVGRLASVESNARPRGRRGDRGGAGQHARPRRLLRRRRHRLHDAHQRGAGQLRATASRSPSSSGWATRCDRQRRHHATSASRRRTSRPSNGEPPGPYLLVVTARARRCGRRWRPSAPPRPRSAAAMSGSTKATGWCWRRCWQDDEETIYLASRRRPRHPLRRRRDQHPVGRRQGRDGHQAGRGRYLPGWRR